MPLQVYWPRKWGKRGLEENDHPIALIHPLYKAEWQEKFKKDHLICAPKTYILDGRDWKKKLKYINNSVKFLKAISYFIDDVVTLESVVVKNVPLLNWKSTLTKNVKYVTPQGYMFGTIRFIFRSMSAYQEISPLLNMSHIAARWVCWP